MNAPDFATTITAKVDEICAAYADCVREMSKTPSLGPFGPGKKVTAEIVFGASAVAGIEQVKERITERFLYFDRGSTGGAKATSHAIQPSIDALQSSSANENGTPIEYIEEQMDGWEGKARNSFARYLSHVESALEHQREVAEAIRGFVDVQGQLTGAVQEHVREIAEQTIAALKKTKKEIEKTQRQQLGEVVKLFASTLGAVLAAPTGAGGLAAAGAAVASIGSVVAKSIEGISGELPSEVLNSMLTALNKAQQGLGQDKEALRSAMEQLRQERLENPDNDNYLLLPPEIGELSTASERKVERVVTN